MSTRHGHHRRTVTPRRGREQPPSRHGEPVSSNANLANQLGVRMTYSYVHDDVTDAGVQLHGVLGNAFKWKHPGLRTKNTASGMPRYFFFVA